jgi:hypothetical protein
MMKGKSIFYTNSKREPRPGQIIKTRKTFSFPRTDWIRENFDFESPMHEAVREATRRAARDLEEKMFRQEYMGNWPHQSNTNGQTIHDKWTEYEKPPIEDADFDIIEPKQLNP